MSIDYVDAVPIKGYLAHAVRNQPENFHRTAPWILITYNRALCGVGRGGMRVRLDRETAEPLPYKGVERLRPLPRPREQDQDRPNQRRTCAGWKTAQ